MIGRVDEHALSPKDFGAFAVICDPWDRKAYPAAKFDSEMCEAGKFLPAFGHRKG